MRTVWDGSGEGRRLISRRQMLRRGALGLGGLALAPLMAACSKTGTSAGSPGSSGAPEFDWSSLKQSGSMTWANWPLYIDTKKVNGKATIPTLDAFRQQTGIDVSYREVIPDYASFFSRIEPVLSGDQATGFDLMTMGYPRWLPLMMQLGYLIPLDQTGLQNFYQYAGDAYQHRSYDVGNRYSVPYESGITGIGYDPALTGREITSVMDLFDPAFKGRVGMFGDTEDLPNLTLLGIGVDPAKSTPSEWNKAADLLMKQRDAGIVRKYYDTSYSNDLRSGNLALSMAWSADILIANHEGFPNLRFVVPDEGGLLWTDSLCIPVHAENPVDAMMLMDFLYEPESAARLTAYIQNVCPVPDARQVLIDQGKASIAHNPLVFPTKDMYTRLHGYRVLSEDEQRVWDGIFRPIYQG